MKKMMSSDELEKAYQIAKPLKGMKRTPGGIDYCGTICELFHDISIYVDRLGNYFYYKYYIGD